MNLVDLSSSRGKSFAFEPERCSNFNPTNVLHKQTNKNNQKNKLIKIIIIIKINKLKYINKKVFQKISGFSCHNYLTWGARRFRLSRRGLKRR